MTSTHLNPYTNAEAALPPLTNAQIFKHFFASALIYGLLLLIILFNPWYRGLLNVSVGRFNARQFYPVLYGCYLVLSPLLYWFLRPKSLWHSKNLLMLRYLARLALGMVGRKANVGVSAWTMTPAEQNAFVFLLIKLYYGPLMFSGALYDYRNVVAVWKQVRYSPTTLFLMDNLYLFFVSIVFLLDSSLFCFGYHSEAGCLKNRIRYVETSLAGIVVCILCYPPFNSVTINFFGASNYNYQILFNGNLSHPVTWILRAGAMLFLGVLISSSLSLFTRASNLTNRGIVDYGPYRYVRHPGYIAKNLFWLMTLLPAFWPNTRHPNYTLFNFLVYCAGTIAGFIGWSSIYYLRAITEEKLLLRDPDYVAYCQRVKYRFIPGVI